MTSSTLAILVSYFTVLSIVALYGWHRYYLVYLYTKHRDRAPQRRVARGELPVVTVQLPIFNEVYVVERLVEAVSRLDYPSTHLEIQVLDDSTDLTRGIAARVVERHAARGLDIRYLHRCERVGFKAGALADGLRRARGDLVAIFDADFIPPPDFLRRTVAYFDDPAIGMVQARWGHINREYSALTRVQAMLLDGHFVVEHGARNRAGCFFNFNGTAGVWRRAAIESAGGWQHDTLTEDLDLSYRAQLAGWRCLFLPDVVVPAELPVEMNAFKSQQHRWAKGSIQTCRKVLPRVLRAPLPLRVKLEAVAHLTGNLNYILLLMLSLLLLPAMAVRRDLEWPLLLLADVPLFCAATLSVFGFYLVSQRELGSNWCARARYLPLLMAVGIGLAVNNSRAVFEALLGRRGDFARTAKFGIERRGDAWYGKRYCRATAVQPWIELGLGLYFTVAAGYAAVDAVYATLPFLLLFQAGFLYLGVLSLAQQRAAHRGRLDEPPTATGVLERRSTLVQELN